MFQNKKGLSEIVGYVLLLLMVLSISVGVFIWLKSLIPPEGKDKCPDDAVLIIKSQTCDTAGNILFLNIENKGNFNIDGFILKASENKSRIPTIALNGSTSTVTAFPGNYYFKTMLNTPLKPGQNTIVEFLYPNQIERISIQPFLEGESKLFLCSSIIDQNLQNCN